MAVNVMIKQNKKELTVEKIASLKGLSYGVADNNFCLNANEIDEYTILYDANRIGRGIELSFENENIWLRLSLPTTKSEICLFYDLIKSICTELQVIEFYRDEELVLLTDNNIFIEADQEASVNAILELEDKLNNSNTDEFLIFGAINPIALGKKEMLKINGSIDGLENL